VRRILRAYPTLLRIGFAEAVAYRAELLVWMLTTTMPLVMLALWTAVARDGQFGRFRSADFVAYYLGALIVRTIASCWVVWELNMEIRSGTLSMRLLRPIHPFIAYSAEHLAAIPLRAAVALPITVLLLVTTGGSRIASDPVCIALIPLTLAGAWLILFFSQTILGSLAMVIERSQAIWEIWMGVYAVMSGYLVPLELMPRWLATAADWLPFRYMLGYPVEVMVGMADRGATLRGLAAQWTMVVVLALLSTVTWRRGLKRFEAYGA
jgi:viologen exporter family transport system permease protein